MQLHQNHQNANCVIYFTAIHCCCWILLLGVYTVWMWEVSPMFLSYMLLPSSGSGSKCVGWVSVQVKIVLVQQTHGGKGGGRSPVWANRVSGQRNVIKTPATNGFLVSSMALKRVTFCNISLSTVPLGKDKGLAPIFPQGMCWTKTYAYMNTDSLYTLWPWRWRHQVRASMMPASLPISTCCKDSSAVSISTIYDLCVGAHSSVVAWGTRLQAIRSRVRFLMRALDIQLT